MENKIQELTDKIYREGVEKGNEEAQRLISSARDEAAKIVEDARKEAESILAVARKSAKETAENTQSEIKLFAGQAVNALKTEIATLLTNEVVSESVKGFVADKEYLNKFIVSLAAQWSANEWMPEIFHTSSASLSQPHSPPAFHGICGIPGVRQW